MRAVAGNAAGIVVRIVAAPYVLLWVVTSEAGDGSAAFLKAGALLQAHRLEAGHNRMLDGIPGGAGSLRWHSPHMRTSSFPDSLPGLRMRISESPDATATTCAAPCPWQRSRFTPGTTESKSGNISFASVGRHPDTLLLLQW